jgi:hypothetical protein
MGKSQSEVTMQIRYQISGLILCFVFATIIYSCQESTGERNGQETELNPAPWINYLVPENTTAGNAAFTLTINGAGFTPDSITQWNGLDRATTFVSSTRLEAAIFAEDVANAEEAMVQVINPSPGGGTSNMKSFQIYKYANNWEFLGAPSVDGTSDSDVYQIAIDREDERILYVNADSGLFISLDRAESWSLAVEANRLGSVGMIAQDPNSIDRLFYGQANDFHVSTDRGLTWNLVSSLDDGLHFISLAVSNIYPNTIYAGVTGTREIPSKFYRSDDEGISWQPYSYGSAVSSEYPLNQWVVAEDPIDGTLYAGGEYSSLTPPPSPFLRSFDGGLTWEDVAPKDPVTGNTTMGIPVIIQIDPETQKLFVLPEGNVVHTSTDHGTTWKRARNWYLHAVFLRDPNKAGRFFGGLHNNAITCFGGAYISTDGAEIFFKFGLEGFGVSDLALSGDSKYLFAASYQSGIFITPVPETENPFQQ